MTKNISKKSKKQSRLGRGFFRKTDNRLIVLLVVAIAALGTFLLFNAGAAPKSQPAVSLALSPTSQKLAVGGPLTLTISLNTNGQNVNVVQADVNYPADKFEFVGTDKSTSAFSIDIPDSVKPGTISITRGSITPINSSSTEIAKVNFRAIASARKANVTLNGSTSKVLSSDTNTNILQKVINGQYSIQ